MKKITLYLLLTLTLLTASCAGIPPVKVHIEEYFIKEALKAAYLKAMTLGYTPEDYDYDKGVLNFVRSDPSTGLRMHVRIEFEREDNKPIVKIIGKDLSTISERFQIEGDMNRLAMEVKNCCGVERKR